MEKLPFVARKALEAAPKFRFVEHYLSGKPDVSDESFLTQEGGTPAGSVEIFGVEHKDKTISTSAVFGLREMLDVTDFSDEDVYALCALEVGQRTMLEDYAERTGLDKDSKQVVGVFVERVQ